MRRLLVIAMLFGCEKLPVEPRPASVEAVQCMRDDECALLPAALTCCVECPPAPPFEAAPGWVLDGMLIENETMCSDGRSCPTVECDELPPACEARAACVVGRCIAIAVGCDHATLAPAS